MSAAKEWAAGWCERVIREDFAEQVAAEIETSVARCPREVCHDSFCWTCRSNAYALGLAAMVRRMGGVE